MIISRSLIGAGLVVVALTAGAHGTVATPAAAQKKPLIQVAILLDTSNSMDGLIDQARTQLWRVVNEFATAKKDGKTPNLQVALYEYGNSGLPAEKGHIRKVLPLTTDLDKVSEALFALKTNGGDEYCGHVIAEATKGLAWSTSNADLKVIFIAGNEPFTQGTVDFKDSCRKAIARGITVNTIYCGDKREGIGTQWKQGADMADGRFMSIDQNAVVADVPAPQDKEIATLGTELNKTYIAYGQSGRAGAARQSSQDSNLSDKMSANVARQVAKSSAYYTNSSWDLVDAKKEGQVDLDKIPAKDLPVEMQKMTPAQRKAHVDNAAKKRGEIQTKIQKLDVERKKFIAAEMKKKAPGANTLDAAIVASARDAGAKKGYRFQ
ncbi:MAG TPA: vWA domain-containing protein [Thermoanaerobaculia bacterium]|jgi:hypothetical protein|nr:vWA domain-containing protein [Thermoanaerobaculia bacterium]